MPAATSDPIEVWINASVAAKMLGTYPVKISILADRGLIACHRIPGCYPTFRLRDIETLARSATTEPTSPATPTARPSDPSSATKRAETVLDALGI
jgi:hypothetical protein